MLEGFGLCWGNVRVGAGGQRVLQECNEVLRAGVLERTGDYGD